MSDRIPSPVEITKEVLALYSQLESVDANPICRRCESFLEQVGFDKFKETVLDVDLNQRDHSCEFCEMLQTIPRKPRFEFWGANLALPDNARTVHRLAFHVSKDATRVKFASYASNSPRGYKSGCRWPHGPLMVDFSPVQKAISACKDHHQGHCDTTRRVEMPGLKVFNCNSRETEPATKHTVYVALSYVWGQGDGNAESGGYPKTIEDAIDVTRRLGYTYLWVDQLCIDQSGQNEQERAEREAQIRQMDRIYQFADLTIVAMAGDDSSYGLAGVGTPARRRQRRFRSGGYVYLQELDSPGTLQMYSKWDSRAWTYQEWAFSRRALVFGETEAWFCCCLTEAERCRETDSFDLDLNSMDDTMTYRKPQNYATCSKTPWSIASLINQGLQRSITSNSDRLNSLSGLLRSFQDQKHPIYHFRGIPILPPYGHCGDASDEKQTPIGPLERSTMDGFVLGLCWQYANNRGNYRGKDSREVGLPSWSWAGWKVWGPHAETVSWKNRLKSNREWGMPMDVSVAFEPQGGDGPPISWTEFENRNYFRDDPGDLSNAILLDAWTFDVTLEWDDHYEELWSIFPDKDAADAAGFEDFRHQVFGPVARPSTLETREKKLTAVVLGNLNLDSCDYMSEDYPFILVVEEKGQWMERVGHMLCSINAERYVDPNKYFNWLKNWMVRRQVRLE